MAKKSALVTGAAGFVGSHVTMGLLKQGWSVTALDNLTSGQRSHLPSNTSDFRFVEGDIRDRTLCTELMQNQHAVFHFAAVVSVPQSFADPTLVAEVNTTASVALLKQAAQARVPRFIYASSSAVYGDSGQSAVLESSPTQPLSPYGASKLAFEQFAHSLAPQLGVQCIGFRYFNIFGPKQNPSGPYASVIPKWITSSIKGDECFLFGDGSQTRDFIFIEDVVHANLLAVEAKVSHTSQVFNIGTGQSMTLLQLAEFMQQKFTSRFRLIKKPARTGDIAFSLADVTRATQTLSFSAQTPFIDGLNKTIESYKL